MPQIQRSFKAPINQSLTQLNGELSRDWQRFFLDIQEILYQMGKEKSFELVNNQSSAEDITGMKFSASGQASVLVEYLVQRISSSVELTESGILIFNYNPTSVSWNVITVSENNPDNAGIVFSMSSSSLGQVQYTTTNEAGTFTLSRIYWRERVLAGKSSLYSRFNR